jgi:hypothetical protein
MHQRKNGGQTPPRTGAESSPQCKEDAQDTYGGNVSDAHVADNVHGLHFAIELGHQGPVAAVYVSRTASEES